MLEWYRNVLVVVIGAIGTIVGAVVVIGKLIECIKKMKKGDSHEKCNTITIEGEPDEQEKEKALGNQA